MRDSWSSFSAPRVAAFWVAFLFVPCAHAQSNSGVVPGLGAVSPRQTPTQQDCGSTAKELGCPINNSVHFHRFVGAVFGWETLIGPPVSAGSSQLFTSHAGYSSDGDGFAYHYGINLANNVEGKFFVRYAAPV